MLAIEMVDKDGEPDSALTKKVISDALDNKLLLLSCGCDKNVIRFIAPTIVTTTEIDIAIEILDKVLKNL